MTSTAISAQRTTFHISGTAASPLTITGITKAASAVITATNTLAVGAVVEFAAIVGMTELNGKFGIVTAATSSTFTVNIDSTAFTTYGSAGTATPQTWTKVGNVKTYSGFDGQASEKPVTNLDSEAVEVRVGLQDFGKFSMDIDTDDTDAGQIALLAAKTALAQKYFKLTLPNGKLRVFAGYVKGFSESGGVDDTVKGKVDIRISGVVLKG